MAKKKTGSKKVTTVELGGSGTTIYQGVVSGVEYKSSLSTEYSGTGLKTYNRMRKSDSTVKGSLLIIKLAILQAEWIVDPASDEDKDIEIKEFIEDALFNKMNRDWKKTLEEILTYLEFGFSVFEKVYKLEDGKVYIKKLAPRLQKSIMKFETEDGKKGVTQVLIGDAAKHRNQSSYTNASIPIEKLVIFSNEKEGDNWRGVSILRAAYKPWFYKSNIEKIDAIGFERSAVGVPVFKMPMNAKPEDVTKANELGENLRANEKAYLVLPFGWEFEMTDSKYDGMAADQAIRRYNRDIYSNVLAHFLALGSGNTGSFKLSTDQSEAFYKSLQSVGEYVGTTINEHVVKELVDLNFNDVKEYPKTRPAGIEKVNSDVFSSGLQRLSIAGLITANPELEQHIRAVLKLPALLEEDIEEMEEEKEFDKEVKKSLVNNEDPGNEDKNKDKDKDKKTSNPKKGKKFQAVEPIKKNDFWRPLTFAENKVNLFSIRRQMDNLEAELIRELPKTITPEISSLLNDARQALQSRDIKRVEDITIKFQAEIRQTVLDSLRKSFESGKLSASNELDVGAPQTSTDAINTLVTRANVISDKITQDLLNQAKLTTIDHIERATPFDEALAAIEGQLTDTMARSTALVASSTTVGGINQGRISVFDDNPNAIYALQRSEILDSTVCNFCISIDGRVVNKDDSIAKQGPFHFHCRGIWVAIGTEEEEKPDITGVPKELRDRIGAIVDFEQIPEPIPLKDSLAEDFVEKQ